jgi:2-polyprenyl-6-methoxyphenol hydroxylase-like FAD-dependent oxidoreductase
VKTLPDKASAADARIVTGERLVAADDTGGRVRVHLASGNTVDSDLLVGAGQGASMAIEDAVILTQRLATEPVPAPLAALAAYEQARRPRITKMLKAGRSNRAVKSGGAIRRRLATA